MASVRFTLQDLLHASHDELVGRLAGFYEERGFSTLWTTAIGAWKGQLPVLKDAIGHLLKTRPDTRAWHVLLEYAIPLRDRRPDALIIGPNLIFVLEFKVGAEAHDSAAVWQVHSYALDLRDFHPGCQGKTIIPVLVATGATGLEWSERLLETHLRPTSLPVQKCNRTTLGPCLSQFAGAIPSETAPTTM